MAITNSIENFKMVVNDQFVATGESIKPQLNYREVQVKNIITIIQGKDDYEISSITPINKLSQYELKKGDSICLDFGNHYVGYFNFMIKPVGSPPDAPAYLKLQFGEQLCELEEDSSLYDGSISSSWIQEEYLHVDILPSYIKMDRRYAFRYVKITVIDTSPKYRVTFDQLVCNSVTSADYNLVTELKTKDQRLRQLDQISLKTMEDCMQDVFEDGPKRDRRLWIGDLRLQALTNYETFKNYDLVKRCLYLFAGLTQNEGHVGACLFVEPKLQVDDTSLFDYGLFFISCLYDYYQATKDEVTLRELWPTAYHQIELASKELDINGVIKDKDTWWCFVDWHDQLNKQASAQAIFIYTLKQAHHLANILLDDHKKQIEELIEQSTKGAIENLWDSHSSMFISGKERQISWASQIWFVLADVLSKEENQALMKRTIKTNPKINMVTPYMYHHFIEALIQCGMFDQAKEEMEEYWGKMVDLGADCFFELFDPNNPYVSPYGSRIINSYCHAWSCTPAYFIRKYFD